MSTSRYFVVLDIEVDDALEGDPIRWNWTELTDNTTYCITTAKVKFDPTYEEAGNMVKMSKQFAEMAESVWPAGDPLEPSLDSILED
jgi:hypothetical protein